MKTLLSTLLLCTAGCTADPPGTPAPTPVTVFEITERPGDGSLRYSANVQPYTEVEVAFQVGGTITWIASRPGTDGKDRALQSGDAVRAGENLAKIDDSIYRDKLEQAEQQLAAAQATLENARQTFERNSKLHEKQFVSDADYESARASYQSADADAAQARAAVKQAETDLSYCTLTAPIDGTVVQRNVETGDLAAAGTVAFDISDTSRVKIVFALPAPAATRLRTGTPLTLSAGGQSFRATVTRIDDAADDKTRAFDVEVTAPNPGGRLRAGMVASVEVPETGEPHADILIPLRAVVRPPGRTDGFAVFLARGEGPARQAEAVEVALGAVFGDRIAVSSGLAPGDEVVVRGATIVHDGEPVRVIP